MPKQIVKHHELQWLMDQYRNENGQADIQPRALALYAERIGWVLPQPKDPLDILTERLSQLLRTETRIDKKSGRPYRANHNYRLGQLTFWFDIDDPTVTREKMQISLKNRRDQMIDDGMQLTFDADHWNTIHPIEAPIVPVMDFTDDINERKAAES